MSSSETTGPRAKSPGTKAKPFSIRLTEEERRDLTKRAGSQPLATYLRDQLLARPAQTPRQRQRAKVKDDESIARVLAALGQSHIANNLNQLAKAANVGILTITRETEQDIVEACKAVVAMRNDLMFALGTSADEGQS
jgi:hypothetical protein